MGYPLLFHRIVSEAGRVRSPLTLLTFDCKSAEAIGQGGTAPLPPGAIKKMNTKWLEFTVSGSI